MDFFDAVSDIRKAYPSIEENEIISAMDAEVRSLESTLVGRKKYRRAVESAHYRILLWLSQGHEEKVDFGDLENLARFVANHRQAAVWAIIQSKRLHANAQIPEAARV